MDHNLSDHNRCRGLRCRLDPGPSTALVGYLVAGILIGPATPGFVAEVHIASQLSEIGVMLLMFGVGLHFSFKTSSQ